MKCGNIMDEEWQKYLALLACNAVQHHKSKYYVDPKGAKNKRLFNKYLYQVMLQELHMQKAHSERLSRDGIILLIQNG